jgi:hypothetical protein
VALDGRVGRKAMAAVAVGLCRGARRGGEERGMWEGHWLFHPLLLSLMGGQKTCKVLPVVDSITRGCVRACAPMSVPISGGDKLDYSRTYSRVVPV